MSPFMQRFAGIIPSLHSSGIIIPGQFGPITFEPHFSAYATARITSWTGMCSVMVTIVGIPASAASIIASPHPVPGTKITDAPISCLSTASATVLYTGTP